jgi:hypothetical protein
MKLKLFLFGYAFAKTAFLTAMLISAILSGCSGNQLTPRDETQLGQEAAQLAACNGDQACRAKVMQYWHGVYNSEFDGGF